MLPIIIVDDAREDVALASRVLVQCQVLNPVATFFGGEECIKFIEAKGDYEGRVAPFLMFLDLSMQPVSGVEVLCSWQKAAEKLPELKQSVLVMLSGVQDLKMVNEGYRCGAATFLTKPLRAEDLLQMLKAVKRLKVEHTADGIVVSLT
ncbi:MAG TPA: response regulator [Verrucomicrobiae bacterium]